MPSSPQHSDSNKQACKKDPSICAACAKRGPTCCYIAQENAELCFPLSKPEEDRLRAYNKGSLLLGEARNSPELLEIMYTLFPGEHVVINQLFPTNATHKTLATNQEGFCLLLGPEGCVLPREVRPWFCKLFPFWVRNEELTVFSAEYCLATKQAITLHGILKQIGQTEAGVKENYNRLRLDWGFVPSVSGIRIG